VRIDSAAYTNNVITPYYDSLIAKLIVWGAGRKEAIARTQRSLGEFIIQGIKSTIPLYQRLLRQAKFLRGNFSTHFVDNLLNSK